MNRQAVLLEEKIRRHIPLAEFMQFNIVDLESNSIRVQAATEPNINIHGSMFAGSQYAVAILTAWALLTHLLEQQALEAELVAADASIKYRRPLHDLVTTCAVTQQQADQFIQRFQQHRRASMELSVAIGGQDNALLQAKMVALGK